MSEKTGGDESLLRLCAERCVRSGCADERLGSPRIPPSTSLLLSPRSPAIVISLLYSSSTLWHGNPHLDGGEVGDPPLPFAGGDENLLRTSFSFCTHAICSSRFWRSSSSSSASSSSSELSVELSVLLLSVLLSFPRAVRGSAWPTTCETTYTSQKSMKLHKTDVNNLSSRSHGARMRSRRRSG